ncbi:PUA domain-containing protein, partial [Desulforudis sp. 1190]|uniref:PUA domain-containing protein n=1 Tax=Desulforudis sp. 1190 TaxID=3416136 RepID=UPI003CE6939B
SAKGRIHVDEGAARALLERGKSLLPSGVVRVEGDFRPGQTVSVINPEGNEIARGIVNFSAEEVARIMGAKTAEIRAMLGRERSHEVIHRNNMAVAQNGTSIKH